MPQGWGSAPFVVATVVLVLLSAACLLGIENPPQPPRGAGMPPAENPYRGNGFLARIHAVSLLLVVPQFTIATFGLVWLVSSLGWDETAAGVVIGASQFIGALGRIAVGHLSDRVGSRVRVLRWVALSGVAAMLALGLVGALEWSAVGAVVLIVAATISVADNGLAYTSVAEAAGSSWAGRALGVQNTGQFIAASAVGPGVGALIALVGYPLAFALVALAPLASLPLTPRADRHA